MLSYKWDEFIFWAVPFVLTGRAAVKAGEGTAGGPAPRTARARAEQRQSCTRAWTQTKSLPLPSVSNSLAKRLRDEPAGCNTVEQMHSNERSLAAPRALYTRPSPPALTTSRLAAPRCPDLVSNSQRCGTGHWDTQWGAHSSALLCCSRPSAMKCFPRCHLCLPAGMRLGNLLDAACVIWPVGDPVVGFLHPLSVSPWRCWKSPSNETSGQGNTLQRAMVTLSLFL